MHFELAATGPVLGSGLGHTFFGTADRSPLSIPYWIAPTCSMSWSPPGHFRQASLKEVGGNLLPILLGHPLQEQKPICLFQSQPSLLPVPLRQHCPWLTAEKGRGCFQTVLARKQPSIMGFVVFTVPRHALVYVCISHKMRGMKMQSKQ